MVGSDAVKMKEQHNQATPRDAPEPPIPARIVIGVTGHREIENPAMLGAAVQTVLKNILRMAPALKNTPLLLSVLSPLAEGADRFIAREILKAPGTLLEAVLPLEKAIYIRDFEADASKKEFEELLALAKSIRVLPPKDSRMESYEQVGRYIVEQCDVLIAFWNGKPSRGRGGTQEIVQYARDNRCPLVWIDSDDCSQINYETGKGLDPRAYRELDDYNRKKINPGEYAARLERDIKFFAGHAESAGLSLGSVRPVIEYLMSRYVRADKFALYYQHLYYRSEVLVYSLALAAVIIAAFQVLFLPDMPLILISEIALMLAVLGLIWISRHRRWHEKWIDYRFLAERFRSALFMAVADVDVAVLRPPRHLSLAYSPKDWMVAAFSTVWRLKPKMPAFNPASLEKIKRFLTEAWIEDQIGYHEGKSKHYLSNHRRITVITYISFGLTIVIALLHVIGIGSHHAETALALLAVILPAAASTTTALRSHRDYLRNSMRSAAMVGHLKELKDRMARAQNRGGFFELVKETEETMLHENEDWRVVVRFLTTEVPI